MDRLFAYGNLTKHTVAQFGDGGNWYPTQEELIDALVKEVCDGCTVLVKGSRSMKMERVTAAVSERFAKPQIGVCCQ